MRLSSQQALVGIEDDVARFARRVSVREDQVDDFTQEGLIGAMRAERSYGTSLRGGELRRAVMKSAVNAIRSAQRRTIAAEGALALGDVPVRQDRRAGPLEVAIIRDLISTARDECAPRQRPAVDRFVNSNAELSHGQIADRIGCSRATVSRAIESFAGKLEELGAREMV